MDKKKNTKNTKNSKKVTSKSKKGGNIEKQQSTTTSQNVILIDLLKPQVNLSLFPRFEYEGGLSCVKFTLQPNQSIRANGGSMNYMTNKIEVETKSGNLWGAFGRSLSGSSFF